MDLLWNDSNSPDIQTSIQRPVPRADHPTSIYISSIPGRELSSSSLTGPRQHGSPTPTEHVAKTEKIRVDVTPNSMPELVSLGARQGGDNSGIQEVDDRSPQQSKGKGNTMSIDLEGPNEESYSARRGLSNDGAELTKFCNGSITK